MHRLGGEAAALRSIARDHGEPERVADRVSADRADLRRGLRLLGPQVVEEVLARRRSTARKRFDHGALRGLDGVEPGLVPRGGVERSLPCRRLGDPVGEPALGRLVEDGHELWVFLRGVRVDPGHLGGKAPDHAECLERSQLLDGIDLVGLELGEQARLVQRLEVVDAGDKRRGVCALHDELFLRELWLGVEALRHGRHGDQLTWELRLASCHRPCGLFGLLPGAPFIACLVVVLGSVVAVEHPPTRSDADRVLGRAGFCVREPLAQCFRLLRELVAVERGHEPEIRGVLGRGHAHQVDHRLAPARGVLREVRIARIEATQAHDLARGIIGGLALHPLRDIAALHPLFNLIVQQPRVLPILILRLLWWLVRTPRRGSDRHDLGARSGLDGGARRMDARTVTSAVVRAYATGLHQDQDEQAENTRAHRNLHE